MKTGDRILEKILCVVAAYSLTTVSVFAATVEESILAIRSVGAKGENHSLAIPAVKELSQASVDSLPVVLRAFEGANPLAINWLRSAVDSIADRTLKTTGQLPAAKLETFVRDNARSPEARRLAYEWLVKVDATAPDRLIPNMLGDASPEFRRDAVDRLMKEATKAHDRNDKEAETKLLTQALSGAVDEDQVKDIVTPLRELGQTVNLPRHFGFLTDWQLIGPFDNTNLKGFDTAYPPETEVNLTAKYAGKDGDVEWQYHTTEDDYGKFDIAKKVAPHKGAVMYGTTTFVSNRAVDIEVRLGTPNAWKLWINGELVFARDEYHRGTFLDQYKVAGRLKPGQNVILLKICQNEQTEPWAQDWTFQLRICDPTGVAILPSNPPKTS